MKYANVCTFCKLWSSVNRFFFSIRFLDKKQGFVPFWCAWTFHFSNVGIKTFPGLFSKAKVGFASLVESQVGIATLWWFFEVPFSQVSGIMIIILIYYKKSQWDNPNVCTILVFKGTCNWSFLKLKNTLNNVTEKSCNTYIATRKKIIIKNQ